MDHFPEQDWVEFARDMLSAEARASMQIHLDGGCQQCRGVLDIWQRVSEGGKREVQSQPSEGSVRIVKALFSSPSPWRRLASKATLARLVFDSFSQPLPALVRSAAPASRQLLHEIEPYTIDLRLETDPAQERISLMGQVLNTKSPEQIIDDVEVLLVGEQDIPLAKASTNSMGEFQIDFPAEDGLQLLLNIRGQKAIGIVLPRKS